MALSNCVSVVTCSTVTHPTGQIDRSHLFFFRSTFTTCNLRNPGLTVWVSTHAPVKVDDPAWAARAARVFVFPRSDHVPASVLIGTVDPEHLAARHQQAKPENIVFL